MPIIVILCSEDSLEYCDNKSEYYDEYDDNGEPIPEEKAGGCGFFHDQIEEIDEDEQEE